MTHKHLSYILRFHFAIANIIILGIGALWAIMGGEEVNATASVISISVADSIAVDITPHGSAGTFATSSTTDTNISVTTTNATGYTLGIAASTENDNALKYIEGGNVVATIPSISSAVTASNYADDTYATANNLNNAWGYRPSKYNSADNTTSETNYYYPGPTSTTPTVLDTTSVANPSTANTYNIAIGARITNTQAPGSYSNTFVITAVVNSTPYTITYNANGGSDTVPGMPSNENSSTFAETVTLSNTEPVRSGYYFKGWCTAQATDGQACNSASGTAYQAGDTWTLNQTVSNNSLVLYALWIDCPSGKICYDANGANVVGAMGQQTVADLDTEIMLFASNYSRSGYGFAGWSGDASAANHLTTATIYGPHEDISFAAGAYQYAGRKLYAVWIPSAGSIQNWTCPNNTTMPIGSVTALTDQRDNETYAVAKLADGKCWMIENMRLGTSGSDDESKAQGFGGVFHGLADPESTDFVYTSTAANSLYSIDETTAYTITGSHLGYRFPRYNSDNTISRVATMMAGDQNVYSYGNYYTFSAATASTIEKSANLLVTTSICPTGWRLPTGGQTTGDYSFGALSIALGGPSDGSAIDSTVEAEELSLAFRSYPNNFLYSGRLVDATVGAKTTIGAYWSRTPKSEGGSYYFYLTNSNVRPATTDVSNARANTMRCMADS